MGCTIRKRRKLELEVDASRIVQVLQILHLTARLELDFALQLLISSRGAVATDADLSCARTRIRKKRDVY